MRDSRLPPLAYPYSGLEPYLDAETMLIHHEHHHGAYVGALNRILAGHPELRGNSPHDLLIHLAGVPASIREAVRHHAGGCANHELFFGLLRPRATRVCGGVLAEALRANFGDLEAFGRAFTEAVRNLFGSGWVWLVATGERLRILATHNENSPLSFGLYPLVGIDLWEHAYHHRFRNDRMAYLQAWWQVLDWNAVAARYLSSERMVLRKQPAFSLPITTMPPDLAEFWSSSSIA